MLTLKAEMKRKVRVTASVLEHGDVLNVRECFYKKANGQVVPAERALLQAGIRTVDLWKDRGSVPHAIVATAELSHAITQSSKASFAQALSNFVTGYTDTQQNLKRKRSMFEVGRGIGLPASYIAARHSIVHGDMPSLIELRRFVLGALVWLWDEYWVKLDESTDSNAIKASNQTPDVRLSASAMDILRAELDATIQPYQNQAIHHTIDKTHLGSLHAAQAIMCRRATSKLDRLCDGDRSKLELLVDALLRPGILLPEPNQSSHFVIPFSWWIFVKAMVRKSALFGDILLSKMAALLASSLAQDDNRPCAHADALKCWLDHILLHLSTSNLSVGCVESVVRVCLAEPGPYTTPLALTIYKSPLYQNHSYQKHNLGDLDTWIEGEIPEDQQDDAVPQILPHAWESHGKEETRRWQSESGKMQAAMQVVLPRSIGVSITGDRV